jgi:hypothetical protein
MEDGISPYNKHLEWLQNVFRSNILLIEKFECCMESTEYITVIGQQGYDELYMKWSTVDRGGTKVIKCG